MPPPPVRRARRRLAAALLLSAAATAASAERPKIGLVLGGGGARGAAHIGVLEELERLRVPVDCIAGTSFGALVAGAWAAGVSPAEMKAAMTATDWRGLFDDNPPLADLDHRHKQVLRSTLPATESGVGADGVRYPPGAVSGQKVKLFINELVRADRGEPDIAQMRLPLALVATDIGTGEKVVFRDGSLTQAMRASMSVPGLLAPVALDGRKLVDGGLVDNLPIGEVRALCQPDIVIAVNVGSPLLAPDAVGSLLTVSAQMVALLTEQNVTRSLQQLKAGDIYLKPVLGAITAGDFERHADAAAAGRTAAAYVADALAALAVPEIEWQAWQTARAGAPVPVRSFADEIRIEGLARANPEAVARHINQREGQPVDTARLNRDLLRVFGDGWYESVDYSLERSPADGTGLRERQVLRVLPVEKSWGPDYLRFGLSLESTLSQGSSYGLRALWQRTWLNRLGAEARIGAEIGSSPELSAQWYQPVDARQRWFVQADARTGWTYRDIFDLGQRLARAQVYDTRLDLLGGVNLARLGQVSFGWSALAQRATLDIGPAGVPDERARVQGPVLLVDFDQLNRLYFPTDGWSARVELFDARGKGFTRLSSDIRLATSIGEWVLGARLAYAGSVRGVLPPLRAPVLGGFLNLSGYAAGEVVADTIRYGHVRAERIVGRAPPGLRGDLRLGLALEVAGTSRPYTAVVRGGRLDSAALYLGGETPLGPVYLGLGYGSQGAVNAYLFLGTP